MDRSIVPVFLEISMKPQIFSHRQNIVSICIDQSGTSVREMQQAIGSVTYSANNYHDTVSAGILPRH